MSQHREDRKETISFRKEIAPNTKETMVERVKADGTIEGMMVRFYRGQELALKVRPYIEHKGKKIEDLVTYPSTGVIVAGELVATDKFLSGDDDVFNFDVSVTVENDDYIKIWVHNTSTIYTYNVVVDITVDYIGGKNSRA